MEENKNNEIDTPDVSNETQTEKPTEEMISMSQAEFEKKIQSETDKVRTSYSKKVKELEAKVKELSPVEKSESEIALENKIAELEKKQAEIEAREATLNMKNALTAKGISNELSAFLRSDVDVDALASVVDKMVSKKLKSTGYVPTSHKSGENMTKEDFSKLSIDARERIFFENPELYKTLAGHR